MKEALCLMTGLGMLLRGLKNLLAGYATSTNHISPYIGGDGLIRIKSILIDIGIIVNRCGVQSIGNKWFCKIRTYVLSTG